MIGLLLIALWHRRTTGHSGEFWTEQWVWSGGRGPVLVCGHCNRVWHPPGTPDLPRRNGSVDPVKRTRA